jgi:hypothetical protein
MFWRVSLKLTRWKSWKPFCHGTWIWNEPQKKCCSSTEYKWVDLRAYAPSGSGYQFSLYGYFGIMASIREGVELNILGLNIGIDPLALAVKLPGIGLIGLRDPWMDRSTLPKTPVTEQVSNAN